MLTVQAIEQFYSEYKKSIRKISELDQKLLEAADSYDSWSDILDEKSSKLRGIFKHNVAEYEEIINSVVKNPDILTAELAEMYLKQIEKFIVEGFRDYGVTAPMLKALVLFYTEAEDRLHLIDAYYCLGIACGYSHRSKEAYNHFTKVLTMCPNMQRAGDEERQFRVACSAYFRLLTYVDMLEKNVDGMYVCYKDALHFWRAGARTGMFQKEKLEGMKSIFRTVFIYGITDDIGSLSNLTGEPLKLLQDEYEFQLKAPAIYSSGCLTGVVYNKYLYVTGQIPKEDYVDYLIMEYKAYSLKYNGSYTFGDKDFISLVSSKARANHFSTSSLFFMNPSCAYIYVLMPELLAWCDDEDIKVQVYKEVHQYFLQLPVLPNDATTDYLLAAMLGKVLCYCPEEGRMIESVHNLLTHRQIATAIHSRMVGELAKIITEHFITEHPSYFYGIGGMKTRAEVTANKNNILNFIWRAGCLHDVGKLLCTDIINLQIRKIIDDEYLCIKTHPMNGYYLLKNSVALSQYADIAGTHHKSYDDRMGYPDELVHVNGPERIFADIVTVCDVIDAAVDLKGRNYAKGKTFDQLLEELKADKGRRYSPEVIDGIENDSALRLNINEFLEGGRRRIQYEVYRRFVITDVQLVPDEDEKFMRAMRKENIVDVAKASGMNVGEVTELYNRCSDYSYLVLDGDGKLFGSIMGMAFGGKIIIMQMYVRREIRRKGIGTMLLDHLKATARRNGIRKMYIPEGDNGIGSAFGKHNGFENSDRQGYMMLII